MVLHATPDSDAPTVEVPVRSAGKRASARNPYTTCKGCSMFMEVIRRETTEDSEDITLQNREQWHDKCFKFYYEQQEDKVIGADAEGRVKGVQAADLTPHAGSVLNQGITRT